MTLGAKEIKSVCELCAAEGYPYNEETCKDCTDNPNKRSDDMEISRDLAIAMLAGVYAIKEKLHREGVSSTYVFDVFNEQGLKTEMVFSDAQNLLSEVALDVIYESEHETTTFKPIATDTRGYACQFICNACDYIINRAHYMRPSQFDYNFCPYCGRPVEREDNTE